MRRWLRPAGVIALVVAALAAEPAAAANNLGEPLPATAGNGAATLTGDFDLDGNLDVASAGVNVRFGTGGGAFSSAPFATGELIPVAIASGDFNEDSRPDLVSTGFPVGASVLLNDPDGGFEPAQTVAGSQTGGVATGDFDGDGNVDIAVNSSGVVRVFRGNGAGAFAAGIDFAGGSGAGPLAASDLDGNGRDDLVAGDVTADAVDVLLAKTGPLTTGPGGLEIFDAAVQLATSGDPQEVLVTDLDGDGKRDLVVNGTNVQALYGDGLGAFAGAVTVAAGPVADVATGSFDGDAVTDLAIARATGAVATVLGKADRTAAVSRSFASGFTTGLSRVTTGDFNEDTQLDVVADATSGSRLLPGETLRVTPAVTFAAVRVNQPSTGSVTILNTDTVSHTITGGTFSGSPGFDDTADGCTGATLLPGDDCVMQLRYLSAIDGPATGTLSMTSDAGNSPHRIALSAQAHPVPVLAPVFDPSAFGEVDLGASSDEHGYNVTNNGDLALELSAVELRGADAGAFKLRDNCGPRTLAPQVGCNVYVRFAPTRAGEHTAQLYFVNDGTNPELGVTLTGTGTGELPPPPPPPPEITLTPSGLDFGRVRRGTSATRDVQVRNSGRVAFGLGALRVAPGGNGFTARQTGCLVASFLPGASCTVTVRFRPARDDGHEAVVSFTGLAGARFTVQGSGYELLQKRGPLAERLAAGVEAWRDRGIEGLSKRGVRLKALAVVLPGKAGLELSMRRKGNKVVLAQGLRRYAAAGTGAVLAKVTKRGRAVLADANKVAVSARLRFRAANGRLTEVVKKFVLRRLTRKASFASCSASPARNLRSASPLPRSGCSPSGWSGRSR